ncbi:hypothetical protein [Frankia sp. QA3]|uniref:hypothetical protein n=1 Tax=Frankia sp. QA3 TaxID=710111 RepID=UPI000269BD89|nr:hypothetical protein [Frankia sp. QA3]EIV91376.1 hypothetical protein FraQA3DRAFT_0821 [Frankia sp. QA3]
MRALPLHALPLHALPLHALPLHALPLHALPLTLRALPLRGTPGRAPAPGTGRDRGVRVRAGETPLTIRTRRQSRRTADTLG